MKAKRFLSLEETRARTNIPDSTRNEMIARGEFPKPVKVSGKRKAFIEDEIAAWQDARIVERDAAQNQAA